MKLSCLGKKAKQLQKFWWQQPIACSIRDFFQRFVFWPIIRKFCNTHSVRGAEFLQDLQSPVIFVANHASHADTVMILSALPPELRRQTTIAAARDYFYTNGLRASIVSLFLNTFPFDRHNGALSLKQCTAELEEGWSLLIYPEGTRSVDGSIAPFKKGVGLLAGRLSVQVVPVFVEGPAEMLPKGSHMPQKKDVTITFGPPVRYQSKMGMQAIADDLRERVLVLQSDHAPELGACA
jgi:1-acyl-sn-glycerol-3-phosphate acyltransferase